MPRRLSLLVEMDAIRSELRSLASAARALRDAGDPYNASAMASAVAAYDALYSGRRGQYHYSPELRRRGADLASKIGSTRAAVILGVKPDTMRSWVRAAGVQTPDPARTRSRKAKPVSGRPCAAVRAKAQVRATYEEALKAGAIVEHPNRDPDSVK